MRNILTLTAIPISQIRTLRLRELTGKALGLRARLRKELGDAGRGPQRSMLPATMGQLLPSMAGDPGALGSRAWNGNGDGERDPRETQRGNEVSRSSASSMAAGSPESSYRKSKWHVGPRSNQLFQGEIFPRKPWAAFIYSSICPQVTY